MLEVQRLEEGRGWNRETCMFKFTPSPWSSSIWFLKERMQVIWELLLLRPATTKIFDPLSWNIRKSHRTLIGFTFWRTIWQHRKLRLDIFYIKWVWGTLEVREQVQVVVHALKDKILSLLPQNQKKASQVLNKLQVLEDYIVHSQLWLNIMCIRWVRSISKEWATRMLVLKSSLVKISSFQTLANTILVEMIMLVLQSIFVIFYFKYSKSDKNRTLIKCTRQSLYELRWYPDTVYSTTLNRCIVFWK